MYDIRWSDLTQRAQTSFENAEIVLIGFPTDIGVVRNGGRKGTSGGPAAIRKQLNKLTPHAAARDNHSIIIQKMYDYGDVKTNEALHENQHSLAQVVDEVLSANKIPLLLGGGHETTFGHGLGYMAAMRSFSILNVDAHADVRPMVNNVGHSGSPFRQLLDTPYPSLIHYTVMGLQYHSVAMEHLQYIKEKSGKVLFREELTLNWYQTCIEAIKSPTLLSIDIDVLDQAFAPGVSAPNANGITPWELYQLAYFAGMNPYIRSVDIVELNPAYDIDDHTARIAALIIWWFSVGYMQRKPIATPSST